MYSAEPLPHFVDEYLAYLYEINPTTATFDGVHVHDDLREVSQEHTRVLAGRAHSEPAGGIGGASPP